LRTPARRCLAALAEAAAGASVLDQDAQVRLSERVKRSREPRGDRRRAAARAAVGFAA